MRANRKLKKAARGYIAIQKANQLAKNDLKTLHAVMGRSITEEHATEIGLQPMVDKQTRIETGAVEFEDDWPCLVIRGDSAMWFAQVLRRTLEACEEQKLIVDYMNLEYLCNLLGSCHQANVSDNPESCQRLKSFVECQRGIVKKQV